MLQRKCLPEILHHLSQNHQALLVTGARQVGKTYLIREACRISGYPFEEFNLIDQPDIRDLFDRSRSADDFLQRLRLTVRKPLKDGTILFFDEIQEADDAITIIKFLVNEGSFRYIFSGSLLGVELKNIRSAPVGSLHEVSMFPMDFNEFLEALGVHEKTFRQIRDCFLNRRPVGDAVHEKLTELFYLYLLIGGMPQAVQTYVDTHDLLEVAAIHTDIVSLYKRDFTKYEKKDKLKLIAIYDAIPSELNKQNKRFVFTYLNRQLKFDRYENSFLWLKDAGVALPVYNAREPRAPLMQSMASNLFKLFMSDVGILNSFYSNEVKLKILNRDKEINNGALFENAAAQLLCANGLTPYYYKNTKNGEVDFLVERDGICLPLEIKSGKNFRSHRALTHLMAGDGADLPEAYIFSDANVQVDGKLVYLPVYMLGQVKNTVMTQTKVVLDLEGL